QALSDVAASPVTVQPGASAVLPLTVKMPEATDALEGRIVVVSTRGDRMGDLSFRIQADGLSGGSARAQVAATRK
ncbi:MAG TPA: hypothetical protein VD973_10180, partial [Symbiobacteriaceae bacterium]|nr:hypothetical protein [Symbiobacteriaceae bacterium]